MRVFWYLGLCVGAVIIAAGLFSTLPTCHPAPPKDSGAQRTCYAIESAVNNFHVEYGMLPVDLTADPTVPLNTKTDIEFLNVLLGLTENRKPPLNTRAIKFLNVKEGKNGKNGLIYSAAGTTVTGLVDPWGGAYYVMLDGNNDDTIKVKPVAAKAETTLRDRKVAVWSNGADCVNGVGGKIGDDVKTW